MNDGSNSNRLGLSEEFFRNLPHVKDLQPLQFTQGATLAEQVTEALAAAGAAYAGPEVIDKIVGSIVASGIDNPYESAAGADPCGSQWFPQGCSH